MSTEGERSEKEVLNIVVKDVDVSVAYEPSPGQLCDQEYVTPENILDWIEGVMKADLQETPLETMTFYTDWEFAEFLETEIEGQPSLGSILALTGNGNEAIACTVEDYMKNQWTKAPNYLQKIYDHLVDKANSECTLYSPPI